MSNKRRKIFYTQDFKTDKSNFDIITSLNVEKDILEQNLREQKQLFEREILKLQTQNNTQQQQINLLLEQNKLFNDFFIQNYNTTQKQYDYYS